MAGAENNQILDPPHDPPVPRSIHLALIAGVKPSVAQHFRGLLRTVPVARKNIRPAHDDLIVVAQPHLDARNRWPDASRHDMLRIVHGADRRRFGQTVDLQHGNAEHLEVILRLRSERRRSADQGLQVSPTIFLRIVGKTSVLASHSQIASPDVGSSSPAAAPTPLSRASRSPAPGRPFAQSVRRLRAACARATAAHSENSGEPTAGMSLGIFVRSVLSVTRLPRSRKVSSAIHDAQKLNGR